MQIIQHLLIKGWLELFGILRKEDAAGASSFFCRYTFEK